jgi:hypothetical protein
LASLSAAAAHVFLSTTRFKELVDIGAITLQAPGKYDLDVVRKETFAHLRAERGGHGTAALSSERAALAREQTATAQIKNASARVDLISLALIQKMVIAMFAVPHQLWLSLGKVSTPAHAAVPACLAAIAI